VQKGGCFAMIHIWSKRTTGPKGWLVPKGVSPERHQVPKGSQS